MTIETTCLERNPRNDTKHVCLSSRTNECDGCVDELPTSDITIGGLSRDQEKMQGFCWLGSPLEGNELNNYSGDLRLQPAARLN